MQYDDKGIKVGDTVVFESVHEKCEGVVVELENNLGECWLYVRNEAGWKCQTLKGVKTHSIPVKRVIEHRPQVVVPRVRQRTRYVPNS